jgi:hypothetical protein
MCLQTPTPGPDKILKEDYIDSPPHHLLVNRSGIQVFEGWSAPDYWVLCWKMDK